ncbi:MAG: hypothetical protein KAS32_20035 [Candidatus Peribacteraceae bacterium]|nr:hypothetical protein [Candidatus Peribacteraceae bacterium]
MQKSKKTLLVVLGIISIPFIIYFYKFALAAVFLFIVLVAIEGLPSGGGSGKLSIFGFKSSRSGSREPKPKGERRCRLSGGDKYDRESE